MYGVYGVVAMYVWLSCICSNIMCNVCKNMLYLFKSIIIYYYDNSFIVLFLNNIFCNIITHNKQ